MASEFDNTPLRIGGFVMTSTPAAVRKLVPAAGLYTLGTVTRAIKARDQYDIQLVAYGIIVSAVNRDELIGLVHQGAQGKHCDAFGSQGRQVFWDGTAFHEPEDVAACDATFWDPSSVDRTNAAQVKNLIANLGVKELRDLFLSKGWPVRDPATQHLLPLAALKKEYTRKMLEGVQPTLDNCAAAAANAQQSCVDLSSSCQRQESQCSGMSAPWYKPWAASKKAQCQAQVAQCKTKAQDCRETVKMPRHAAQLQLDMKNALACYNNQFQSGTGAGASSSSAASASAMCTPLASFWVVRVRCL
jgi:hypothetical protein